MTRKQYKLYIKLVRKIANQIRKKCERFAFSYQASDRDFYKAKDLACMCAVASFTLSTALKKEGIKNKVMKGLYESCRSHCWVELENGIIVDITATQFRIPKKVLIISNESIYFEKYNKGRQVFYRDLKGWDTQKPESTLTKIILDIPI